MFNNSQEFVEAASRRKQEGERLRTGHEDVGNFTTEQIQEKFAVFYDEYHHNKKSYEDSLKLAGFARCWFKKWRLAGKKDFHRYILFVDE